MNDLSKESAEFFDREGSLAFSVACGLALENREDEAQAYFHRSIQMTRRVEQERAGKFFTIKTPKP